MLDDLLDDDFQPSGKLVLQTLAMPADTNPNGDIFAGWLLTQMDLAGAIEARNIAKGRVTTVAVGSMAFLRPVKVGAIVSCYAECIEYGRSSMTIRVCVWTTKPEASTPQKVTEGEFTFVAIDDQGRTRRINKP